MTTTDPGEAGVQAAIRDLVTAAGGDAGSFQGRLVGETLATALKLITEGHDTGQIKLITRAMKEMRYAYRVFNRYRGTRKVSIFGSARTQPDHPDYHAAREFGAAMAKHNWMSITGAGDGIMKAGHEGPQREASFGLSIRLPFETTANTVIAGDPKLVNFRYFFTRKLMFLSHSDAIAVFPGGYGTQDELFESLTLVQTGKSNIVPIVLVQGAGHAYWQEWVDYIDHVLEAQGMISPEDKNLYHLASSVDDAVEHVTRFYRVYHSSRYVRERLVLRLSRPVSDECIADLNEKFTDLLGSGRFERSEALPQESDHLELPRIVFHHNRTRFARIRSVIARINADS